MTGAERRASGGASHGNCQGDLAERGGWEMESKKALQPFPRASHPELSARL